VVAVNEAFGTWQGRLPPELLNGQPLLLLMFLPTVSANCS